MKVAFPNRIDLYAQLYNLTKILIILKFGL